MTTVLVIDDSPSEMAKFRDILTKNNFTILEATNGERGIQLATEHVPDVILMDVVMPEMNGFQATRKITRNKITAHIPVIIVSTKDQETDRVWGKRQGAKEYLTKPFSESELLNIIKGVRPATVGANAGVNSTVAQAGLSVATAPISQTVQSNSPAPSTPVQPQSKPSNGIYL